MAKRIHSQYIMAKRAEKVRELIKQYEAWATEDQRRAKLTREFGFSQSGTYSLSRRYLFAALALGKMRFDTGAWSFRDALKKAVQESRRVA